MKKKLAGELKFKKVSQGVARFDGIIKKNKGNLTITLDEDVIKGYDPQFHDVTGSIQLIVEVNDKVA